MMADLDELDRLYQSTRRGLLWLRMTAREDFDIACYAAYPGLSRELRAARSLIEALLQAPEWIPVTFWQECPFCGGVKPGPEPQPGWYNEDEPEQYKHDLEQWRRRGHRPDCPRVMALKAWRKARGEG